MSTVMMRKVIDLSVPISSVAYFFNDQPQKNINPGSKKLYFVVYLYAPYRAGVDFMHLLLNNITKLVMINSEL